MLDPAPTTEPVALAVPPDCGDTVLPPARPVELAVPRKVAPAPLGATEDVALIWERMVPLKDPDMFSKLERKREQRVSITELEE
jgi:hypothetical protein